MNPSVAENCCSREIPDGSLDSLSVSDAVASNASGGPESRPIPTSVSFTLLHSHAVSICPLIANRAPLSFDDVKPNSKVSPPALSVLVSPSAFNPRNDDGNAIFRPTFVVPPSSPVISNCGATAIFNPATFNLSCNFSNAGNANFAARLALPIGNVIANGIVHEISSNDIVTGPVQLTFTSLSRGSITSDDPCDGVICTPFSPTVPVVTNTSWSPSRRFLKQPPRARATTTPASTLPVSQPTDGPFGAVVPPADAPPLPPPLVAPPPPPAAPPPPPAVARRTVHAARVAAPCSFPTASVARTAKECSPSPNPTTRSGDAQSVSGAPSTLQRKAAPSGSVERKTNVASLASTVPDGA